MNEFEKHAERAERMTDRERLEDLGFGPEVVEAVLRGMEAGSWPADVEDSLEIDVEPHPAALDAIRSRLAAGLEPSITDEHTLRRIARMMRRQE